MSISKELIDKAKSLYNGRLFEKAIEHYNIENYNEKNHSVSCPFHEDKTPSMVLNSELNNLHCFSCNKSVDILDILTEEEGSFSKAIKKLFEEVKIDYNFNYLGIQNEISYKYPKRECNKDRSLVEQYLKKRKISKETLDFADVQQDEKGNMVFHYYDDNDVLTTVAYRPARKLKDNDSKLWFQKEVDNKPILYNMNRCDPSKPLVITEGQCFKGETEILTPEGWIKLKDYSNQKVLQINENMEGSFITPLAYVKHEYEGKMYSVRKRGNYTFDATEEHNMVYIDKKNNVIKRKAKDMPKSINGKIPTTVKVKGTGIPLSNDQIALYLAVSADCTIDRRDNGSRYSRFVVKKERKYLRLKNILNNLNIEYFDNPNAKHGYKYLGFKTPIFIKSKMFPDEWIEQATLEQRKFIIEEMVEWDGNHVPNRKQYEFSTKFYSQALWMQTIAHTCGFMSTIIRKHPIINGKKFTIYKVSILLNKTGVSFQKGFDEIYDYKGMVYCVTVPTGMILVRQEEHISVCGNCDTLSIIEAGYHNVVSVPNGSQNMRWIEECWNWLEQFDKIIIFGDNDEPGIKMRNEVIRRLGSWRCSFVEITDIRPNTNVLCKDANEILYFYGKDKILEYIKHPTETPVEGVLDLFSVEDVDYDTMPGLYTHIKQFDDKIVKLFYSQLVILTGKSGEGKSSFLSSVIMAQALEQNESLYIYSGELSPSNVKNWLSTSLLGRENIKMKNNVVRIFNKDKYAKLKEWSKEKVFIHDNKKGIDEDSILNSMEETTRKKGCKIFCIDNLMSLNLKATAGDDLKAQTAFINRLKNFADKYQVLVILVSHPRKGAAGITHIGKDDIAGSSNIVNLADIVISVKRYSDKEKEGETNNRGDYIKGYEPVPYDVCIEVIKNRINGQMPKIDMYYDPVSMRFYNDLEGLWYRFKFDDNTTPIPDYDPNPHGEKEGDSPL